MIRIHDHSGIYTLESEQTLPVSIDQAWSFFSTPDNLAKITPPHMGFHITSRPSGSMYKGQIITYSIGLLPGVRRPWVTEITHVQEGRYFVDEQRFGPYALWHHQHWFHPKGDSTDILDRVSYKLPFGPVGRILHPLIRRQLIAIFTYRSNALAKRFCRAPTPSSDPMQGRQIE